jgi:hypothetical protein
VPSLLETFRVLSAFDPPRGSLRHAPWEEYVDWAIAQGLAPLAAYDLEYRLGGADAPQWARDRLLSIYQGSLNDNVMKLVNFKRCVDELQGRKIVLLGSASFAEALYPHVAFRPLADLHVLVRAGEAQGFCGFLRRFEFQPAGAERGVMHLSDGRTELYIHGGLLGDAAEDAALLSRALPLRAFGPSVYRLDLEDSILATCLEHSRAGYDVPTISFVDLRELLLGAPALQGPYSRPFERDLLVQRARAWRIERALFTSASVIGRLFPDAAAAAQRALPELRPASRALLERLVVGPVAHVGHLRSFRGTERLRRLLAGGR